MKQLTKMSRTVQMLEKLFNMLNADWFDGKLETPIITVIPTPRAYAHYTTSNVWKVGNDGKREINIASGTLNRPLEEIAASMQHEMIHYYNDVVANVQDCSRNGQYHSKKFAVEAVKRGLNVERSDTYGYAYTSCGDDLLEWILNHIDSLREIEICRVNPIGGVSGIGGKTASGNASASNNSHSIKYSCPACRNSVRATKTVNVMCGDCMVKMLPV